MSILELENISLKDRIRDLSKLLPVHQKDITKICELEYEIIRLKDTLKEFEKRLKINDKKEM